MENKTVLNKKYGVLIMLVSIKWHIWGYFAFSESFFGLGKTFLRGVFKHDEYEMLWWLIGGLLEVLFLFIPVILFAVLFILTLTYSLSKTNAKMAIAIFFMILNSIICIVSSIICIYIFSISRSGKTIGALYGDSTLKLITAIFFNPLIEIALLAVVITLLTLTFVKSKTSN